LVYQGLAQTVNTRPAPPVGLSATAEATRAVFSWENGFDLETATEGLTYNLRIGTTPGGTDVLAPMSTPEGPRKIPAKGNVGNNNRWVIRKLNPGTTYYWSLQTVDKGFAASAFSEEQSLTMPDIVEFKQPVFTARETDTNAVITMVRRGNRQSLVTVEFLTRDGSALNPLDYTATSGVVSFTTLLADQAFTVAVWDDATPEDAETVELELGAILGDAIPGDLTRAILIIRDEDTDQDGLSDDWEEHYFGHSSYTGANDVDGDGLNNLGEFIAGTVPTNAGSRLEMWVTWDKEAPEQVLIEWTSVSNRVYHLYRTTNLLSDVYIPFKVNVQPTPPVNAEQDINENIEPRFYRIGVQRE
jgi:hypothetical protein